MNIPSYPVSLWLTIYLLLVFQANFVNSQESPTSPETTSDLPTTTTPIETTTKVLTIKSTATEFNFDKWANENMAWFIPVVMIGVVCILALFVGLVILITCCCFKWRDSRKAKQKQASRAVEEGVLNKDSKSKCAMPSKTTVNTARQNSQWAPVSKTQASKTITMTKSHKEAREKLARKYKIKDGPDKEKAIDALLAMKKLRPKEFALTQQHREIKGGAQVEESDDPTIASDTSSLGPSTKGEEFIEVTDDDDDIVEYRPLASNDFPSKETDLEDRGTAGRRTKDTSNEAPTLDKKKKKNPKPKSSTNEAIEQDTEEVPSTSKTENDPDTQTTNDDDDNE